MEVGPLREPTETVTPLFGVFVSWAVLFMADSASEDSLAETAFVSCTDAAVCVVWDGELLSGPEAQPNRQSPAIKRQGRATCLKNDGFSIINGRISQPFGALARRCERDPGNSYPKIPFGESGYPPFFETYYIIGKGACQNPSPHCRKCADHA